MCGRGKRLWFEVERSSGRGMHVVLMGRYAPLACPRRWWYLNIDTGTSTGMQFHILSILNMIKRLRL